MRKISRKNFLQIAGVAGASAAFGPLSGGLLAQKKAKARVVVVGGGFAGATCARYIRRYASDIDVTLIEPVSTYHTCPMSNAVIGGLKNMSYIAQNYKTLASHGIQIVSDTVTEIDAAGKKLTLKNGSSLSWDFLVVAPGIDFKWGEVEGYDEQASHKLPHAYKAGPQTELLISQLKAMPSNGTVIIAAPGNPFRCPPGPYERAGMIAHYMKKHKPQGKLVILDAKDSFAKQGLFQAGWDVNYPGMIEWVSATNGGKVVRADAGKKIVVTANGTEHKADVINLIPPQKAGHIAHKAGLTKGDWCPVDQRTFESSIHKDVYVIGDASIAGQMPKSGFAANSQGKVCAAAIVSSVKGMPMPEPSWANTCYSLVTPDYGISVAAVYKSSPDGIISVKGAGGTGPKEVNEHFRKMESVYAFGWYSSITADTWG